MKEELGAIKNLVEQIHRASVAEKLSHRMASFLSQACDELAKLLVVCVPQEERGDMMKKAIEALQKDMANNIPVFVHVMETVEKELESGTLEKVGPLIQKRYNELLEERFNELGLKPTKLDIGPKEVTVEGLFGTA